jgi:hypothetical protein
VNGVDPVALSELIQTGGIVGLMTVIIIGALRAWWLPAWVHKNALDEKEKQAKRLEEERDWWRNVAMRSLSIGETAVRQRDEQG